MSPGFQQGLHAGQRQEMRLLPRMLQAVEVLQLPSAELSGYLLSAFEENEALDLDEAAWKERARAEAPAPPAGLAGAARGDASDRHEEWLRSQPARDAGLNERVEEQLALREVDPVLLPWVRLVVSALDASGYLSATDDMLLAMAAERELAGGEAELGRAIGLVQSLEPRGIGGRNAIEALLLQLDPEEPDYALLCLLLEDFLEDVSRNKLPAVARAMGLDLDELEGLIARLRELELRPAAELVQESTPAIHPDVLVEADGAGFVVRIDDSGLPPMRIDPEVRRLTRDRSLGTDVRRHLRGRIDQARWLLQALEQRKETLQRVATALFAHQEAFLRNGPDRLRPLKMGDVADWLGVHTSTVSRAVAGKYAQTPLGIFPLRWFFQSGSADDAGTARHCVRDLVGEIVAAEDAKSPLSDDQIVGALADRGHKIARRTVAKYRTELGIPSSYRRRDHGR
ncbi:MAG: RNA polymerase factor sigma-54 [Planctomycetota bacterium]